MLEEIILFTLCQGMKWNHLPEPGGLYAQNPKLVDRFYYIMAQQAEHEAREAAKRKREQGGGRGRGLGTSRGR